MHASDSSLEGGSIHLLANVLLVFGFLFISFCKAGVSIAEFSTVGRVSGKYSACGFAAVVLAKHAMGMVMTWGVPHVLASAEGDAMLGIFRVQLTLLGVHIIAVGAGVALACGCTRSATAGAAWPALPPPSPRDVRASPHATWAQRLFGVVQNSLDSVVVVVLIGLWRALAVGSLHGYHTIRVRFLQSRGLPLTEAGATLAA